MNVLNTFILATFLCVLASQTSLASNNTFQQQLLHIQNRWAQINYQLKDDDREAAYEKLATEAEQFARRYPQRAEPLVWQGIVVSTWAGARGGLGALGLVKQARSLFEQSLKIDDKALNGSAYTSLGSLYYQVPGWPIGFGDDDRAQSYLEKAMRIDPESIDANYFYADFLIEQGEYKQAVQYLQKALQAPARPQRPLADRGRRAEIHSKLAMLKQQHKSDFDGFY